MILLTMMTSVESLNAKPTETIVLGGGCFWCLEAIFQRVKGVEQVVSGYAGGRIANPTYREVSSGLTGHAEVVKVTFNPEIISLERILEVFFKTHDPTTLNRQGADVGTQYRSVIFYGNEAQKKTAQKIINLLTSEKIWDNPILTELSPLSAFYKAEDYHQNYFDRNPNQGYCQFVIVPKLEKFRKLFQEISTGR
jgi:peptide-methionine (S)-S-oxide reductase